MALKKGTTQENIEKFKDFNEAEKILKDKNESIDRRIEALEYMIDKKEFVHILKIINELFKEDDLNEHPIIDYTFSYFSNLSNKEEAFSELFKILKSDNAYLRNSAIKFLQTFGKEVKDFVKNLLDDEDKDIRIFAINILGDVEFEDSVDMLRYVLLKEKDINVLATAIDYLGEIGTKEDIELLENIKKEQNNPFIEFAINTAIERIKA